MPRPLVSLCTIARDAGASLGPCLDSLRGVVDELCVLDTGSRDDSAARARDAGARVAAWTWRDDFAAARNACAELARGRWILVLDADERLLTPAESARARIQAFDAAATEDPQHAQAARIAVVSETASGTGRARLTRFFRHDGRWRYRGRVHEQLVGPDGAAPARADLDLCAEHSGYRDAELERCDKLARNARLLRLELAEHPQDGYAWFQLGRTLARAGEADQARSALHVALERTPERANWRILALEEQAYLLRAAGESARALAALGEVEARFARRADTVFLIALLALDAGDLERATRGFARALTLGDVDDPIGESARDASTCGPATNLGVVCEVQGRRDEARAWYQRALELRTGYAPAQAGLARLDGARVHA